MKRNSSFKAAEWCFHRLSCEWLSSPMAEISYLVMVCSVSL